MRNRLAATIITIVLLLTAAMVKGVGDSEREVFQVTFGTRGFGDQRRSKTDAGKFVVEAEDGDIIVVGYGASYFTDTDNDPNLMIARIDRSGNVVWRRIFDDLDDLKNHEVMAVLPSGNNQYILFKQRVVNRSSVGPALGQKISVREVHADGWLSRELGSIDDLYVSDVLPYEGAEKSGFLIMALNMAGATNQVAFKRDISLYDLWGNGTVTRPRFPEGIKGARLMQRDSTGNLIFYRTETYFGGSGDIVRASVDGSLFTLATIDSDSWYPVDLLATEQHIIMISRSVTDIDAISITAFSHDGQIAWRKELREISRFGRAISQDEGVVVSGSYEGNPILIRFTLDGERQWTRRFRSTKNDAYVEDVRVLSDGWLAVTGATLPGSSYLSSRDADAFLAVADANGEGFAKFGNCMVDTAEIEALRDELRLRVGLEVERETIMSPRRPVPDEDLPPLNEKLSTPMKCGDLSEHELLMFLQEANEETRSLNLSRPSERTKIHVQLREEGSIPDPGYREWTRLIYVAVPSIEVDSKIARKAMRYAARELLPFTERMLIATEGIEEALGISVQQDRGNSLAEGVPSFRENTYVVERFLELFNELTDDEKTSIRSRVGYSPLKVAVNRDALHLWGSQNQSIIVGKNRIDEIFTYMLESLPAIEKQIADRIVVLENTLGLSANKADPDMLPATYVALLDRIIASTAQLSAGEIETIRNIGAAVRIVSNRSSDLYLSGYNREIDITPVAADSVLKFLIESEDELLLQDLRWK